MGWEIVAIILFLSLICLLATGLPIAFSLGFISMAALYFLEGIRIFDIFPNLLWHYSTVQALTCLPLFILMAEVLVFTGIGSDAYIVAYNWLGRLPGGLAISSTVACGIFAAICGSSTATAVAIGLLAIPEMLKRGYDKSLAAGSVAAGGTLGILIPPSAIMIIYGVLADQSISRLFMAGFVPGIMLVILFSIFIFIRTKISPSLAPPSPPVSWKSKVISLRKVIPIFIIVVLMFGCLYTGIATPTEVAGLGAFIALLSAVIFRKLSWNNLKGALLRTLRVTSFVFLIVFGAMSFAFVLSLLKVPQNLCTLLIDLNFSPLGVIASIVFLYIILGCFIEPASILVITVPIFLPILTTMGIDLIWFGVVATVAMELANITPPVGLNLFVIKGIVPEDVSLDDIIKGIIPYAIIMIIGIALLTAFPQLALWLPGKIWK